MMTNRTVDIERVCEGGEMFNGLTLLTVLAYNDCFQFKFQSIEGSPHAYKRYDTNQILIKT